MIREKLLSPIDLSKAQILYIYKAAKVVLVNKHKNFVLAIFYVVPPCFEYFNNGQKLTVMSFVLRLGQNHSL